MRIGTLSEAAAEHGVTPGRVRMWAIQSGFPPPINTEFRPYTYDLDAIAQWAKQRPGKGARTDLQDKGGK